MVVFIVGEHRISHAVNTVIVHSVTSQNNGTIVSYTVSSGILCDVVRAN